MELIVKSFSLLNLKDNKIYNLTLIFDKNHWFNKDFNINLLQNRNYISNRKGMAAC